MYLLGEPIRITGWVAYYGTPIFDVLLDVRFVHENGIILTKHVIRSDSNGNFTFYFFSPKVLIPGNYTIYVISNCREEHRGICTNQGITVPVSILKGIYGYEKPSLNQNDSSV